MRSNLLFFFFVVDPSPWRSLFPLTLWLSLTRVWTVRYVWQLHFNSHCLRFFPFVGISLLSAHFPESPRTLARRAVARGLRLADPFLSAFITSIPFNAVSQGKSLLSLSQRLARTSIGRSRGR